MLNSLIDLIILTKYLVLIKSIILIMSYILIKSIPLLVCHILVKLILLTMLTFSKCQPYAYIFYSENVLHLNTGYD